jgi:hypothetical protein
VPGTLSVSDELVKEKFAEIAQFLIRKLRFSRPGDAHGTVELTAPKG